MMNLGQAIKKIDNYKQDMNEYVTALKAIRGINWQIGIDDDRRQSVIDLKNLYNQREALIDELLSSEIIKIDRTTLMTAVSLATKLVNSKPVGLEVGNVPQAAKAALQSVILESSRLNETILTEQIAVVVNAQALALENAIKAFHDSVIKVDRIPLKNVIDNTVILSGLKIVGIAAGNVSQTTIDNLLAALDLAAIVYDSVLSTQLELDAQEALLLNACTEFNSKIIVLDLYDIDNAITVANSILNSKTVGILVGQVPAAAFNDFEAVIKTATNAKENNDITTQGEIDSHVATIESAKTVFLSKVILVSNAELADLIAECVTYTASFPVGVSVGCVTQAIKDAFAAAIAAAITVKDKPNVTVNELNAQITVLKTAYQTFKDEVLTDTKAKLAAAISDANTLMNSKTVGIASGNVPQKAKDTIKLAIDSATLVLNDINATQLAIEVKVIMILSSIVSFNKAIIA